MTADADADAELMWSGWACNILNILKSGSNPSWADMRVGWACYILLHSVTVYWTFWNLNPIHPGLVTFCYIWNLKSTLGWYAGGVGLLHFVPVYRIFRNLKSEIHPGQIYAGGVGSLSEDDAGQSFQCCRWSKERENKRLIGRRKKNTIWNNFKIKKKELKTKHILLMLPLWWSKRGKMVSINQSSIFQDYYIQYIQVIGEPQWLIVAVIQGQT